MSNPWEKYPHIWPTKSSFFTFLRGGLRRGLWEKYPPKLEFKNKACSKPPEGYTGRAKTGAYCALSGEWTGKSKLEVDHIKGNVSLQDWDDVLPFIIHLCSTEDNFQLVSKEAHKIKSYSERMGISYEEAVIKKEAIQICKMDEKKWLQEKGIVPASNATKRREQVEEYLRNA